MKYKSSGNNIFGSNNFDPDFIEYLYCMPVSYLNDLYITWQMLNKDTSPLDIDKIHKNKPITNRDINRLDYVINNAKIDLSKINED